MINCRLSGATKTIYLTAKSLEIIALAMGFSQTGSFFSSDSPKAHGHLPGAREKEQLNLAWRILDRQYHDPPGLDLLARQTGPNQTSR